MENVKGRYKDLQKSLTGIAVESTIKDNGITVNKEQFFVEV